jgi:7,8-dihydropterin-6-yl-methyl-4-(beta-D-ribofuranosyl)aminobenzene 5'-phosphate synthase
MPYTNVKITILIDDLAGEGLVVKHGLTLWIENENNRLLFGTGQGGVFANNVGALDIELGKTDMLVLSYGHYDHTGGLPYVLQYTSNVNIYGHPGMVQPRYSFRDDAATPIQMPRKSMVAIDKLASEQLHWVRKPIFLSDKIGITGPIPRETSFEDPGGPFYHNPKGKIVDHVEDDLALWIRKDVCVGCAHSGLVNTLDYIVSDP